MSIGRRRVVDITASLSVDGTEQEIPLVVIGQYFPADRGDPWARSGVVVAPECALYEVERIDWYNPATGRVEPFPLQFCDGIWEAIGEKALAEVESE